MFMRLQAGLLHAGKPANIWITGKSKNQNNEKAFFIHFNHVGGHFIIS